LLLYFFFGALDSSIGSGLADFKIPGIYSVTEKPLAMDVRLL